MSLERGTNCDLGVVSRGRVYFAIKNTTRVSRVNYLINNLVSCTKHYIRVLRHANLHQRSLIKIPYNTSKVKSPGHEARTSYRSPRPPHAFHQNVQETFTWGPNCSSGLFIRLYRYKLLAIPSRFSLSPSKKIRGTVIHTYLHVAALAFPVKQRREDKNEK